MSTGSSSQALNSLSVSTPQTALQVAAAAAAASSGPSSLPADPTRRESLRGQQQKFTPTPSPIQHIQ